MSGLSEVGRVYGLETRISPVVTTFGFLDLTCALIYYYGGGGGGGPNCYLLLEFP